MAGGVFLKRVAFLAALVAVVHSAQLLRAQDDATVMIARIEAPQVPNRQGLDGLTLQEVMRRFRVPGLSVAVIKDFDVHWIKAYGVADVETDRPVQVDSLFQAASISKVVTAIAVLRLVQEGRLSLDDDVNRVLRSWQIPKSALTQDRAVTLRSLLSHTSGTDDGFGFPGYDPVAARPTVVQILNGEQPSNVGPVLFARPPFQAYKYSGGGITIVQLALTDLLDKSFADIMQTHVLASLDMADSSFEQPLPEPFAVRAVHAHNGQGRNMPAPWHVYPEQAAAGLWTTPRDLARVLIEVQRAIRGPAGRVLKQAAAIEMVSPIGVGPFAVGVMVEKHGEGWYFRHDGSNFGFAADALAHVRKGYGVVVMANGGSMGDVIREVESRVASAYNWDSLDKPLVR